MSHFSLDPALRVLLADLKVNVEQVLRRSGQPVDLLSRGSVRLPAEEYYAVWQAIEDLFDGASLALGIADSLTPEVFDPPIFAALCSRDLNEAASRLARYERVTGPVGIEIDRSPSATVITMTWPATEPPMSLMLTRLLLWVATARIATRHHIEPTAVGVPVVPSDHAAFRNYLGVELSKTPEPRVVFSAVDASRPFLTANPQMWEVFEPKLRTCLAVADADASIAERVRAVLLELLPGGEVHMDAVARVLAISTRTLHRRLRDEATSFRQILKDTRESLAMHYLADEARSIDEISFLLGFEDPSSFYRAFRDWTGDTPRQRRGATV